jgi:DNA invertase Pin-like site-specific DNA recombinase
MRSPWVSTEEQDVGLQLDALHQAGCPDGQIFLDVASGTSTTRPGLEACLRALAPGADLHPGHFFVSHCE